MKSLVVDIFEKRRVMDQGRQRRNNHLRHLRRASCKGHRSAGWHIQRQFERRPSSHHGTSVSSAEPVGAIDSRGWILPNVIEARDNVSPLPRFALVIRIENCKLAL